MSEKPDDLEHLNRFLKENSSRHGIGISAASSPSVKEALTQFIEQRIDAGDIDEATKISAKHALHDALAAQIRKGIAQQTNKAEPE